MSVIPQFTQAEQLAAYRLIMDEDEAQEMAAGADEINASMLGPGGSMASSYAETTLVLLSMVSEETAAKVEAYRRLRPHSAEEWNEAQRQWEKCRAETLGHIRIRKEMAHPKPESFDAE